MAEPEEPKEPVKFSAMLFRPIGRGTGETELLTNGLNTNGRVVVTSASPTAEIYVQGIEIPKGTLFVKGPRLILEKGTVVHANIICEGEIENRGAIISDSGSLTPNTPISESSFTKNQLASQELVKQEYTELTRLLQGVAKAKDEEFEISPSNAVYARQREGVIVTEDSGFTVAGTDSAVFCGIAGLYSKGANGKGMAAVFHTDGSEDLSNLAATAAKIHDSTHAPVQLHLRGGDVPSTYLKILSTLTTLIGSGDVVIASADVIGNYESLAIDAKTGKTSQAEMNQMNTSYKGTFNLFDKNAPIRITYDGTGEHATLSAVGRLEEQRSTDESPLGRGGNSTKLTKRKKPDEV